MSKQSFQAMLRREGGKGSWVTLTVPFRVEDVFGTRGRVPVKGTINGVAFRNSLMPTGDGTHYLVVNGDIRTAAGAEIGDTVEVVLDRDTKPRVVRVPANLLAAIKDDSVAKEYFDRLAPSHQREYVGFITEAKKPETQAKRVEQTVAKLREEALKKKQK